MSDVDLTAVERLMKRCQTGVPRHVSRLEEAHSIMADCYGKLGAMSAEITRLREENARLREAADRRLKAVGIARAALEPADADA